MIKQLFRKMLPAQIISSLAMVLCTQIDTILTGQFYGVDGVAAYGLISPVIILFTALTGILSVGISTVCSGLVGKGDTKGINKQFSSACVTSFSMGIFFMLVLLFTNKYTVAFLGGAEGTKLYSDALGYLNGYAFGIPAYFLMSSLTSYLQIAGKRKLVYTSIATMTVMDIAFDLLNGFVFKAGMFGMAIATTVSEYAGLIVVLFYFFGKDCMFRLNPKETRFRIILNTLVSGLPIAVNQVCFTISMIIINGLLLKHGGSDAVAIFSVLGTVGNIGFSIGVGIGNTTQVLSGIFCGEEDTDSVLATLREGLLYGVILGAIFSSFVFISAPLLAQLYISGSADIISRTASALRCNAFITIPLFFPAVLKSYYPCIKKLSLSLILSAAENLFLRVPVFFVMASAFGLTGIWFSQIVAELLICILVLIITFVTNKDLMLSLAKLSLLGNRNKQDETNSASFEIRDSDSLALASSGAGDFCRNACGDGRFSNYVALCVEEMAADIMQRSFREGKNNAIFVRLVNMGDEWIIRLRDNCEQFDTAGYISLHHSDDAISHLGIKIVFKLVTEAKYINSLGLNCLTLRLKK